MTRIALFLAALALPGCAIIAQLPPPVTGHYDKGETTAIPVEDVPDPVTAIIEALDLWREPGCPDEWCNGPGDGPGAPDSAPADPPADPPDLGPPDPGPDNGGTPDTGTPGGGMGPGPGNGGGMMGGGND